MKNILENRLPPLIKYPGGKEKELNYIIPALPAKIDSYYEPFVGGGALYFAINAKKYYINDKSDELVSLYKMVKEQNREFFNHLNAIERNWNAISKTVCRHEKTIADIYYRYKDDSLDKQQLRDKITELAIANAEGFGGLPDDDFDLRNGNKAVEELCARIENKMARMRKIEEKKGSLAYEDISSNIESALKAAFYMHFRTLMNNREELGIGEEFAAAAYFFIRQVCYSSMFRYNKAGKFNVPYGGISYNRKSFAGKIAYYQTEEVIKHLEDTTIGNMDFYDFMNKYKPEKDDFVFLDPPYDSEFSTYAKNEFGKYDQARLADYLINECNAMFMIVIKNTEYISSLYREGTKTANGERLYVSCFDKKYFVSFQDRNDKNAQHLLVTNYKAGE